MLATGKHCHYKIRCALQHPQGEGFLRGSIQHIFDEDAVAGGGVIDQDMVDGADELAVLDDGTAAHE